jgi:hypothetical protein
MPNEDDIVDEQMIDAPPHYTRGDVEVHYAIVGMHLSYTRGLIVSYIARAGFKESELADLKKARWYLNQEIERVEQGSGWLKDKLLAGFVREGPGGGTK